MSGKTRVEVYRRTIDFYAQTLPDIITLSFIHPISKTRKLSIHLHKSWSPCQFQFWAKKDSMAGLKT